MTFAAAFPARRILVVEDEPAIADTLVYALRTEGFAPVHCLTGRAGWAEFEREPPALIVLDVGLPDTNGFEWCKALRQRSMVPVLFLTARHEELDRVVGLEIGGDDYVTKPFSPREVTARIKAILRRSAVAEAETEGGGTPGAPGVSPPVGLHLDPEACVASWAGTPLELTRYELRLLTVLAGRPGRVYSRDALMSAVWEDPGASLDRTVDAHVKTLRAKLRAVAGEAREFIRTHRGLGYSWVAGAGGRA